METLPLHVPCNNELEGVGLGTGIARFADRYVDIGAAVHDGRKKADVEAPGHNL